ncbi:MAG TPA: hypothetical protein VGM90_01200 [Kofleriaceae bacterium]|jgi:hypothetical protein
MALAACGGKSASSPMGSQIGPAMSAALDGADKARAPYRCAAADGPEVVTETVKVGDASWMLAKHVALRVPATMPASNDAGALATEIAAHGDSRIGVIADAGGAAPTTIAALGRLRATFSAAELVLVLGGMGTTKAELVATLGALTDKATYAVIAMPGDLEDAGALTAAIAELRAKGAVIFDGRLVQKVVVPDATIALVAGVGAPGRTVAGSDGCVYARSDVDRIAADLVASSGVRILASNESPRVDGVGFQSGDTPSAYAADPAMGELSITAAGFDVALHGPSPAQDGATNGASGGENGVTRKMGGARIGGATEVTPGSADATPRLPGGAHAPTAGLLTVANDKWIWDPIVDAPQKK